MGKRVTYWEHDVHAELEHFEVESLVESAHLDKELWWVRSRWNLDVSRM